MLSARHWMLLWRYRRAGGQSPNDARESLQAALQWLCAAQDAVPGGGIAQGYSLRAGWGLPYPETTGYIIPTFLALQEECPELQLRERAWRAGHWLAEVQFDSGAICSKQTTPENTKPSVFNTGMVLHGWLSLLHEKDDKRLQEAACKAANWLIQEQEADGSWVRNAFNGIAHSYYTMVDWALVRYALQFRDTAVLAAAVRNLDWTLQQQRPNGWFDRCWFDSGGPVTTHTLSYTTQGLVECGRLLGERRYVESALRSMRPLRRCFESFSTLAGTFDDDWQPTAQWQCCTGNAQTSLVWQALGAASGDSSWLSLAQQLSRHMLHYQKLRCRLPGIDGAIPGSWPISGSYDPFEFPNHAAKFHVDALVLLPKLN